jgi:hypothetical protein
MHVLPGACGVYLCLRAFDIICPEFEDMVQPSYEVRPILYKMVEDGWADCQAQLSVSYQVE